jgi:hypothetical protein
MKNITSERCNASQAIMAQVYVASRRSAPLFGLAAGSTCTPTEAPRRRLMQTLTMAVSVLCRHQAYNNQAWANHYDGYIRNGPNRAPAPAPDSPSFDDRITSKWDKHYDVLSKEGSGTPHAPAPDSESSTANPEHGLGEPSSASSDSAVPVPGSFDNNVDGLWAQRYTDFLKNGPNKDNRF